jgi:zinc-ribbon domain
MSTKFCTNCGKPLAAGVRFCNNCGTPVSATPSSPVSQQSAPATGSRFRVRARSSSYPKLVGSWKDVQVSSVSDWTRERQALIQEFRARFGKVRLSRARFGMAPGTLYDRWNDQTWARLQDDIAIDGEQEVLNSLKP